MNNGQLRDLSECTRFNKVLDRCKKHIVNKIIMEVLSFVILGLSFAGVLYLGMVLMEYIFPIM